MKDDVFPQPLGDRDADGFTRVISILQVVSDTFALLIEPPDLAVIKADTSVVSNGSKGSLPLMQWLLFTMELLRDLVHI